MALCSLREINPPIRRVRVAWVGTRPLLASVRVALPKRIRRGDKNKSQQSNDEKRDKTAPPEGNATVRVVDRSDRGVETEGKKKGRGHCKGELQRGGGKEMALRRCRRQTKGGGVRPDVRLEGKWGMKLNSQGRKRTVRGRRRLTSACICQWGEGRNRKVLPSDGKGAR